MDNYKITIEKAGFTPFVIHISRGENNPSELGKEIANLLTCGRVEKIEKLTKQKQKTKQEN